MQSRLWRPISYTKSAIGGLGVARKHSSNRRLSECARSGWEKDIVALHSSYRLSYPPFGSVRTTGEGHSSCAIITRADSRSCCWSDVSISARYEPWTLVQRYRQAYLQAFCQSFPFAEPCLGCAVNSADSTGVRVHIADLL